ncbi:MAG: DUF1513 domain-containing protein [Magnetovibrionaceae bacterium]
MHRRNVLTMGLGGVASLAFLPRIGRAALRDHGWFTGFKSKEGGYGLARISPDLDVSPILDSAFRLHDVLIHPKRFEICAPARRPGNHFWVLNEAGETRMIRTDHDRHCFGHGCYSLDGKLLYLPENDFDGEKGVISVYDVESGYRKRTEFPSNGVGPHQVLLTKDGKHLIVANGGILTHPETGRAKLNLDSMEPNLTLMETARGQPLAEAKLAGEWHQLSIRHIGMGTDGSVVFGLQDQGPTGVPRPLVGLWQPGSQPVMLEEPEGSWLSLKSYVGSVAFDASGQYIAATSPKSGRVVFWNRQQNRFVDALNLRDVCGLSPVDQQGGFLVTTGEGSLARVSLSSGKAKITDRQQTSLRFDNHCTC